LGFLTFVRLWLAFDRCTQRKMRKLADKIADLQRKVDAQDQLIGHLTRALAVLTGGGSRPIPSERDEDIRVEVAPKVGPQARAQLPSVAGEDEPEEEETRVYTGRARRRPTQDDSSPTLPSRGNEPLGEEPDDGSIVVEARHADGSRLSNRPDSDPDSDEL
jgi:hypothetical protein